MMLPTTFLTYPFAHRTLHDVADNRPENSLAGARAALAAGYGMEIDLQLSKDGQPVVFHDYSLDRLTEEVGPVARRTAAELQQIRLSGTDECIPTLQEFLELVGGKVPLLVEIKDQDGALGPNTGTMEKAVCDVIKDYQGPLALMSFNPHSMAKCAQHAPDIPRGLVTDTFSGEKWNILPRARLDELVSIPDYDRVGASFISHNWRSLQSPPVEKIRALGGSILSWTIRSAQQEKEALENSDNVTFENYYASTKAA